MQLSSLTALSPLDGRYQSKLIKFREISSEYALIKYRLQIEIRWLITLSTHTALTHLPQLEPKELTILEEIINRFDIQEAEQVKALELKTNHDVKAVEYYLQNQLLNHHNLSKYIPFIHFACTSEDINSLAYGLMLLNLRKEILLPYMEKIITRLESLAAEYQSIAMISRTHGQPASPTTLGKEFVNVITRLVRQYEYLKNLPIMAKFNGAVGNYNAHYTAYREIDWLSISNSFIQEFGLTPNVYTTQIEPHDNLAEFLHGLMRFNTILIDFNRDIWGYISLGYLGQLKKENETGSSTMPHKINPIDFENSEGNLGICNALADHLANKLPISRWQRDLTDSTVLRNLGSVIGYAVIAFQSLLKGLDKLKVEFDPIQKDLNQRWEVLAEAVQTVLRRNGVMDAYEQLKKLTRGQEITKKDLHQYIEQLDIPVESKQELLKLTPEGYIGYAVSLTQNALKHKAE